MEENNHYVKFAYIKKEDMEERDSGPLIIHNPRQFKEIGKTNQLDWLRKMVEYIRLSATYELRYLLKRGEIYEIDFGVNINSEFSNRHYGVVLVDSGPKNPLVLVCPLKTNHTGGHKRSDVVLGIVEDLSENAETIAVVNQVRAIDKFRILRKNQIGLKRLPISIYEEEENIEESYPQVKRLTEKQFLSVRNAYLNFIEYNGKIHPELESDENY